MAQNTRVLAALALGGGLAAGGYALAHGPNMQIFAPSMDPAFSFQPAPERVRLEDDDRPVAAPRHRHTSSGVAARGYGNPICVRLCDGFFFPTASTSGGDAACAAQCPDAPTALYTMPADRIENAVSLGGKLYTQLPVAKRYQTSFESTCTCHRGAVASRTKDILNDLTLRKGDVVMTASGFRVYEGGGYGASSEHDFVSLSRAGLPKDERATLAAMEHTSAGSPAPAAPALAATRLRGNVTVDDGEPAPAH